MNRNLRINEVPTLAYWVLFPIANLVLLGRGALFLGQFFLRFTGVTKDKGITNDAFIVLPNGKMQKLPRDLKPYPWGECIDVQVRVLN